MSEEQKLIDKSINLQCILDLFSVLHSYERNRYSETNWKIELWYGGAPILHFKPTCRDYPLILDDPENLIRARIFVLEQEAIHLETLKRRGAV